jgi:hypothetical protein
MSSERIAHPRRDGSLKIKLDACRRRMERLVLRSYFLRARDLDIRKILGLRMPQ